MSIEQPSLILLTLPIVGRRLAGDVADRHRDAREHFAARAGRRIDADQIILRPVAPAVDEAWIAASRSPLERSYPSNSEKPFPHDTLVKPIASATAARGGSTC